MLEQASLLIVSLAGSILVWLPRFDHGWMRTTVNWIGILAFSLPWFWSPMTTQPRFTGTLGTILAVAGVFFLVFGTALCVKATRKITAVVGPGGHGEPSKLMTDGVYGIARHPVYSGLFMAMLGWSLIWGGIYSDLLLPILYALFRLEALLEERLQVEKKFREAYVDYRKRVPAFFPRAVAAPLLAIVLLVGLSLLVGWVPLE